MMFRLSFQSLLLGLCVVILGGCAATGGQPATGSSSPPVRIYFSFPAGAEQKGDFTVSCMNYGRYLLTEQLNRQLARSEKDLGGNAAVVRYVSFAGGASLNPQIRGSWPAPGSYVNAAESPMPAPSSQVTLQGVIVNLATNAFPSPNTYFVSPEKAERKGLFTCTVAAPNEHFPTVEIGRFGGELDRQLLRKEQRLGANAGALTLIKFVETPPFIQLLGVALQAPEQK